jgi:hypothetical protein
MHSPNSINVVESYLNRCLNVKDGRCNMTWKHDECRVLMEILYEMTEDNKYKEEEWVFDPGKKLLWE